MLLTELLVSLFTVTVWSQIRPTTPCQHFLEPATVWMNSKGGKTRRLIKGSGSEVDYDSQMSFYITFFLKNGITVDLIISVFEN